MSNFYENKAFLEPSRFLQQQSISLCDLNTIWIPPLLLLEKGSALTFNPFRIFKVKDYRYVL